MKITSATTCFFLLLISAISAVGSTPDWLRNDAHATLPSYPAETDAVVLRNERTLIVAANGEMKTRYRRSVKILRRGGQGYGEVLVGFDKDTRLTYLKAWSIAADGEEYEVKEKDAVETSSYSEEFYSDFRHKALTIPASEPGTVIGYEYEQKERPYFFEDHWQLQEDLPVRYTRYELQLPPGWNQTTFWQNLKPIEPTKSENRWIWEAHDLPAIGIEPDRPSTRALAAAMVVNFAMGPVEPHATWSFVGTWWGGLAETSNVATPELRRKLAELTASSPTVLDKIRSIARFSQSEIRYVAIEIGIGNQQPHLAGDTLANRYGDCKDKATLMRTLLKEAGVTSYYILVNTRRGVMRDEVPSATNSNHVILAVALPSDVPTSGLLALVNHPKLGRLLIFDPTDHTVSFGYLPSALQGSTGMLATPDGGEPLHLPVIASSSNSVERNIKVRMLPDDSVAAEVTEIRRGDQAFRLRAALLGETSQARSKAVETYVSRFIGQALVTSAQAEQVEDSGDEVRLRYQFRAENYLKHSGSLVLFRPQIIGETGWTLENKKRVYPIDLNSTVQIKDNIEFELPVGATPDELPAPAELKVDLGEFRSSVSVKGSTLRYTREFSLNYIQVESDRVDALRTFLKQVAGYDRRSVVLKGSH